MLQNYGGNLDCDQATCQKLQKCRGGTEKVTRCLDARNRDIAQRVNTNRLTCIFFRVFGNSMTEGTSLSCFVNSIQCPPFYGPMPPPPPPPSTSSKAPLYLESDHEATDPKTSLRSAAQQNTQTQSDPATLFVLISSEVPRATHVAVLQCLRATFINALQPCIPTQLFVHFLRLSQVA